VLASAQGLAWVFDSSGACTRAGARELAALERDDVASVDALALTVRAGPIAEVLRAAAELELPLLEALPPIPAEELAVIALALEATLEAAPSLPRFTVSVARPLGLRGRAFGSSIVIGLPGIDCPDAEHAAWQAAHEATVMEVAADSRLSFLDLERRALALLRSRARAAGLAEAHGRWLSRLDLRALGPIADVDDASE